MAGCTPRSHGKPSMASIANGAPQKSTPVPRQVQIQLTRCVQDLGWYATCCQPYELTNAGWYPVPAQQLWPQWPTENSGKHHCQQLQHTCGVPDPWCTPVPTAACRQLPQQQCSPQAVSQNSLLALGHHPHSIVGTSPATPVLQLPQTVAYCWWQLPAVSLVPVESWHTCATSGHRSGAWLHSLLGMVSWLRSASRVHVVFTRLHACCLIGTAMPSLTGCHVMLQLWAAGHEVAWLVAVIAGAWPRAATSTTTSTMSTCKTFT